MTDNHNYYGDKLEQFHKKMRIRNREYNKQLEDKKNNTKKYKPLTKEEFREQCREYYKKNKEYLLQYNKKYREKNKDEVKEYYKQYYIDNKDKLKKKVTCNCGAIVSKYHLSRHKKTKKHIDLMKKEKNDI